jgi:hypothetical protein
MLSRSQTIPSILAALKILEQYWSIRDNRNLIIEDGELFFYLPKGKTVSKKAISSLESHNWTYHSAFHCFSCVIATTEEMLTSSDKNLREHAKMHTEHLKSRNLHLQSVFNREF